MHKPFGYFFEKWKSGQESEVGKVDIKQANDEYSSLSEKKLKKFIKKAEKQYDADRLVRTNSYF